MFKKIKAVLTKDLFSTDDSLSDSSNKENVPESAIVNHNQLLSEIKILSSIAKTLDSDSFTQSDFLFYLDIRASFAQNNGAYEGLENSAELLRVAIAAQSIFLKIEQTELRYRSLKQQEYYNYVLQILTEEFSELEKEEEEDNGILIAKKKATSKKVYSPEAFKDKLDQKLAEINSTVKSEEGKTALNDYAESVKQLATKNDIGLRLLYLFKRTDIKDLSILRVLSDMVNYLQSKDLRKTNAVVDLVRKNQEIFIQVTRIIGLPKSKETLENYALILQYLGLSKKHEKNSEQFFRLIEVMQQWVTLYNTIEDHRSQYPAKEYNLPPEYKKEIMGVDIYRKYEKYIDIFK
ncbi:hypothetical protein IQ215_01480 [Cyanobacterium stanieri LEGE 03274]|uniref:Uncharacterized protein n=1 Tax=Cyanobacterium stanieri LEGE 03274 TaxID=1828756 RepID=A0ABR9V0G2_9CHRO|nr:hypothetical protein [Cyanobacterium stanieri]MBE9221357.1 hypothetical protein [Cyanobacterium stanieri LEGE 03274]